MTNAALRGKPEAGNLYARFDEGEVAPTTPRRGSLLYKSTMLLASMSCTMLTGGTAFAVEPVIDGTVMTFTVEDGAADTYSAGIDASYTEVVKRGGGSLTLSGGITFGGTFRIEEGTLAVAPNLITGAGKPSAVISDGATLDISGAPVGEWTASFRTVTVVGDGVDGTGAIKRSSGGNAKKLITTLSLSGNATVAGSAMFSVGNTLNLNGHRLTKSGSGQLYLENMTVNAGAGDGDEVGELYMGAGTLYLEDSPVFSGNGSLRFGASSQLTIKNGQDNEIDWSLSIDGNTTFNVDSPKYVATRKNKFTGPVSVSAGTLTLKATNAEYPLTFSGGFSTLGTAALGVNSGVMTFEGPVNMAKGMTVSGGRAYFKGGTSLGGQITCTGGKTYFDGDVTQTGASYSLKVNGGEVFFRDADSVLLSGTLNESNKGWSGRVEIDGVKYFRLGGAGHVIGPSSHGGSVPATVFVTNSVLDAGAAAFVVGNGYTAATLEMWDSMVTNKLTIGGTGTGYPSWAGVYQHRGLLVCPAGGLALASGTKSMCAYVDYGGAFTNASGDVSVGAADQSFASIQMHDGPTANFSGALKLRASGTGTTGGSAYYQSGGTCRASQAYLGHYLAVGAECLMAVADNGVLNLANNGLVAFSSSGIGTCILALNSGGTVASQHFQRNADNGKGAWYVSYDGGKLRPTASGYWNSTAAKAPDRVFVHEGGIVVDSSGTGGGYTGYTVPLEAPTGMILDSVEIPSDSACLTKYYAAPPQVRVVGSGVGAAAIAIMDESTHRISGVKVVAPGSGYDETTRVTIDQPARGSTYELTPVMKTAPTTGQGLTKTGAGGLYLPAANTYLGPTAIEAGYVKFIHAQSLPASSGLSVSAGAYADFGGNDFTVPSLAGSGAVSNGNVTVTGVLRLDPGATFAVEDELRLSDGARIEVSDVAGVRESRSLLKAGSIVCDGRVEIAELPAPWVIRVHANRISVARLGFMVIFK